MMNIYVTKKHIFFILTVCLLIVFSGCSAKAAVNPNATNGNGTPSVNLDDIVEETPAKTENSTASAAPEETAPEDLSQAIDPETGELNPALAGLPAWEDDGIDGPSLTHQTNGEPLFEENADVIEIKEKMFVAQSNEIYINAGDYLGKTIKYEGIFTAYTDPVTNNTYYSVIRIGPGCCGIDGNCGFEVLWEDGRTDYPKQDDWVEVTGVLEEYEEDGLFYLQLKLKSLKVLDVRGAETVTQ